MILHNFRCELFEISNGIMYRTGTVPGTVPGTRVPVGTGYAWKNIFSKIDLEFFIILF